MSERLGARIHLAVWKHSPLDAMSTWKARLLRALRLMLMLGRVLMSGDLTLRAMGLAYVTLVSMVPLLALSFSVLTAFGVHNQLEPLLQNVLAPLGTEGEELTRRIVAFIAGTNVRVLGTMGFAILLYTAVTLVQRIEESFNFIWRISRPRGFGEQFLRYVSVLLVGPFLLFLAIGIGAAITNQDLVRQLLAVEPFGKLAFSVGRLMPAILVTGALAFGYAFMPNTKVRRGAALLGGLVAGVLWQLAGWVFALFVSTSTSYAAIYSSFAVLILFMIWVYVSWLIVLFGASVAFHWQHPQKAPPNSSEGRPSNRVRERLALLVASRIATNFRTGHPAWSLDRLSESLGVSAQLVNDVLDTLCRAGVLTRSDEVPPAFVPARDPGTISVAQLMHLVRQAGESEQFGVGDLPASDALEGIAARIDDAIRASLSDLTIEDLAVENAAEPARSG